MGRRQPSKQVQQNEQLAMAVRNAITVVVLIHWPLLCGIGDGLDDTKRENRNIGAKMKIGMFVMA